MYLKFRMVMVCALLPIVTVLAQDKPEVTIGGALRYNYNYSSWKEGHQKRGGDFGLDVFRLNAKANYKKLSLDAEYRLYSTDFGGGMLKHGYVGYELNDNSNLQLGLTQVPFGILPYNSNSFFFSMNYYVGLEDDYDMGIKYSYRKNNWELDLGFFKNAEELRFGSNTDTDPSRYSYDVGSIVIDGETVLRNKEVNQLNGRVGYNWGSDAVAHHVGTSAQYGGLYNLDTEELGNHYAFEGHYQLKVNRFGLKAGVAYYKYNAENPLEQGKDLIAFVAYGASYMVAAEAYTYTAGASYTLPVNWEHISSFTFYNDFGMLDKCNDGFEDAFMNVTGVMVSAGPIYTYIDYAMGKNQPWLSPEWTNGLGAGNPDAEWEARFNINIGYYF
ncbi:TonB-dependent receptor [Carboxylicivirga mesophila]|uniref:TonB-dependent receptor n=1 Tax=Carboxylicivirga mesophila TaxID=1166478 RepID=A0ABS5KCG1_9BACT|nr:TonB-dependent receptor [Carboxylicivirga mesophila]MBS2212198.1 TonB-dependent receptor [Carboxylicivirga mesophila]